MAESYGQYCGAARALDLVGDRWTLLIVRELGFGPRRFTDLVAGLPGISRNLLAQRLRELESDGVAEQVELPPPVARRVYQLTADGKALTEAIRPLVAWGARRLGQRKPTEAFRPHWAALAMAAFADRTAAAEVREAYQYEVGGTAFYFDVDDGLIELHEGRVANPAVTVTTDEETWAEIASGTRSTAAATREGRMRIKGAPEAVARLRSMFSRKATFDQMRQAISKSG